MNLCELHIALFSGSEHFLPLHWRGYTGHEHLPKFGLINMNARLYDPALGRFLSPNPYIQDPTNRQNYNRYSYCLNNPLKYTDPTGEKTKYTYNWYSDQYEDENGNWVGWYEINSWLKSNYSYYTFSSTGTSGGGYSGGYGITLPRDGRLTYNQRTGQFYFTTVTASIDSENAYMYWNLTTTRIKSNGRILENNTNFLNFELGLLSTINTWESGYFKYNEAWHLTKTRGLSTILNKARWNNNGARYWRSRQTKALQAARNAGKIIQRAGYVGLGADILLSGEIYPSDVINGAMIGASATGVGSVVSALWFVADYGTLGINYLMGNGAVGLGDMIDNAYGKPLIKMYDGFY